MITQRSDPLATPDPQVELERELINEYLRNHCPPKVAWRELPEETVRELLTEASRYASSKLAEHELRARWVERLHGTVEPGAVGVSTATNLAEFLLDQSLTRANLGRASDAG